MNASTLKAGFGFVLSTAFMYWLIDMISLFSSVNAHADALFIYGTFMLLVIDLILMTFFCYGFLRGLLSRFYDYLARGGE